MGIRKYLKKLISEVLKENKNPSTEIHGGSNGMNQEYLFDFKRGYNQSGTIWNLPVSRVNQNTGEMERIMADDPISFMGSTGETNELPSDGPTEDSERKMKRVKPIDVVDELETMPRPWDLDNLDDKIFVFEDKVELIKQEYTKREAQAMLERLKNRRVYTEKHTFFDQFPNTNEGKIHALVEKYGLVMKESDLFIPEFPADAILIMKEYTKACEALPSGKKPVFYVIAEADKFREAYEKRDPILVVQSPFGFYYQILDAWDKEMEYLPKL